MIEGLENCHKCLFLLFPFYVAVAAAVVFVVNVVFVVAIVVMAFRAKTCPATDPKRRQQLQWLYKRSESVSQPELEHRAH